MHEFEERQSQGANERVLIEYYISHFEKRKDEAKKKSSIRCKTSLHSVKQSKAGKADDGVVACIQLFT